MIAELFGHVSGVIVLMACFLPAQDFLEGNDVRVNFAQDFGDAVGADASIHAAALVDIVGGDAEAAPLELRFVVIPIHLLVPALLGLRQLTGC
jgi:hypothetical protein